MEKPKIDLAAPKVIIKNEELRNVVKSWEVGKRMSTSELSFFSSLLNPEDFFAIPEIDDIAGWEVVSTPKFSSNRLGSIKERGVVRPIPKANTSLDIDNSIKKNTEAALEYARKQATEQYRLKNLDVLSQLNETARQEIANFKNNGQHRNTPLPVDWSRFLVDKAGQQPSESTMYMYEEYLRTGNMPTGYVGKPLDLSIFTNGDVDATDSIVDGIQKLQSSFTEEMHPDFINRLIPVHDTTRGRSSLVSFTENNVVYGDAKHSVYMRQFVQHTIEAEPMGIFDEIYDDIGKESVDKLTGIIHSSANELGYTRHRAMDDFDIEDSHSTTKRYGDYQEDVFEHAVAELKKEEPELYNYLRGSSPLFQHEEEQLIHERNERARIINPAKAEQEYIAKKEAMIERNIAYKIGEFFDSSEESQLERLVESREYLDGRVPHSSTEGFSEDEIEPMRQEARALNDIRDENEKSYKRLISSSFEVDKDGELVRIKDKTPRRPTDKFVMAGSGMIQPFESTEIGDYYKVAEDTTTEQLSNEIKEIRSLLTNPELSPDEAEGIRQSLNEKQASLAEKRRQYEESSGNADTKARLVQEIKDEQTAIDELSSKLENKTLSEAQRNTLENYLIEVSQKRDEQSNRIASFRFNDPQGSFASNLTNSYQSMLEAGQASVQAAEAEKAIISAKIKELTKSDIATPVLSRKLEELQEELAIVNNVIRNRGYDKATMGRTIVDGESVKQIGLTKDDYLRYLEKPENLAEDMGKLHKHKILVDKANSSENISTWLDAELKGRIIAGDPNDTIGYKVKVSPDLKIATLVQPAVRVDALEFMDTGITNAELVSAIKSGNLDYDARPTSHIVDMEPIINYADNEHMSVVTDPIKRVLFHRDEWDEKKIGYVRKDIDALFDGTDSKTFNLTEAMKSQINVVKEEWDATNAAQVSSLSSLQDAHKQLLADQETSKKRLLNMRGNLSALMASQEEIKKSLLTASKKEAKVLRQKAASVVEEIEEIHQSSKLISEHLAQLNTSIIEKADAIAKARSEFAVVDEAKEKAFGIAFNIHQEKETARLERNAKLIETLGVDTNDTNDTISQLKINKDKFSEIFLSNINGDDNRFPFNKYFRSLMGSQLTHVEFEDYGEAAAGMLEMFMKSQDLGKEIDTRTETYARQVLNDVSSGEARTVDDLTVKQLADYNERVKSYAKMDTIDRLQASLFEDFKQFIFKEMFNDGGIDEPEYAHAIRQLQRRLSDTYGTSTVTGEFIHREIANMRRTLGQATKVARARLEEEFGGDIPISKEMASNHLKELLDNGDDEIAHIASDVAMIREIPEEIFKLSVTDIDKVVRFQSDVSSGSSEVSYGLLEDIGDMDAGEHSQEFLKEIQQLREANPYDEELARFESEFKGKLNAEYGNVNDDLRQSKESYEYFRKKEIVNWMEDGPDKHEFRATVDEMEEFSKLERSERIDKLREFVKQGAEGKETKQFYVNVINNIDKDVTVKPVSLAEDAALTLKILGNDSRWTQLVEGNNPYYQNVEGRMKELQNKFKIYTGQKHGEESLALAREFKGLREFAFISMTDPGLAGMMADIETLSALLPEGDLMRRGLANPTENLLSQMMQVAEENGKSLRAVMQVPGQDIKTEVELRKLEDGTIEAYSEDLKQGFAVNDSGQGRIATARTEATAAYARDNNIAAVKSASIDRPILRHSLPTHSLAKRNREAVNIGNITAGVVDSIQALKDGSTIMGYDIETTMTGAKHLTDVTQPIDIYAEKIQYDPETGQLLEKNGMSYINTTDTRVVENPDGSFERKAVDIQKHSSFSGIISLNDQSKKLIGELSEDPTRLIIDFGEGKESMHVADIADALDWRKDMSDADREKFNAKRNKFLRENMNLSHKDADRVKAEINTGLEHLRFLSNVSKYGMSVEERGNANPIDLPKGVLDMKRELSAFELLSQGKFVPTHDEIMNRLLSEHISGVRTYDLSDEVANKIFGVDDMGNTIRIDKGNTYEKMVVAGIQEQYTGMLLDTANKASTILDSEELSKLAFGQHIDHFTNQEDAIRAFREFAEMDDVKLIIGSNTELADNVTLIDSLEDKEIKVMTKQPDVPSYVERREAMDFIADERNKMLNESVGQFTDEFNTRFVLNPASAEKFSAQLEEKRTNGEDVDKYLRKKKSIVVKDLSDALSYLPILSNNGASNVTFDSQMVKDVDSTLAELTHTYESLIDGQGKFFNDADQSILDKYGLLQGKSLTGLTEVEVVTPEKMKLKQFFDSVGTTDQQVIGRYIFPELRSLSNESILDAMGIDISDAHASNIDVQSNIKIHGEFIGDVANILNGGEAKYPGIASLLDTLNITKDTANIYEQESYKVGDYVFMKEAYDNASDKPVTYGQVGVYRIEDLDEGFKSFTLSRQVRGENGMMEDTSIERLEFKASTNAMLEAKAANKLRFISSENDQSVMAVADEYQADITREHFNDIFKSDNRYYSHVAQANTVTNAFENNPLFSINNAGSVIDNSNSRGMIELETTPIEKARNFYLGAQSIINQKVIGVNETPNGRFQFNIGTDTYHLDNTGSIQTVNINGMDVEALLNTGIDNPVVRINPRGILDQHSFSELDQNILRGLQGGIERLNSSDQYYVPEISKEHLQALEEFKAFNNTGLGQETRMLMDDVVTLKNMGVIKDKASILSKWNEAIIEQANELDARRPVRGMAVLDKIDYMKTHIDGDSITTTPAQLLERSINLNSPKEAVDSMLSIINTIGRDYKGIIKGTENRESYIATNFLVNPMIENGILPTDFNAEKVNNLSLDHIAVTAFNHTQENGISNPLTRIDYRELADIMDTTGAYEDFAGTFRAMHLDDILGNLTLNQQLTFEKSRELLNQAIHSGMYVNGMDMTAPIDLNIDDAATMESLKSKDFFRNWTVEDLKLTADSLIGSDNEAHIALNRSIYGELAERAAGGVKSDFGIDPARIRDSGDLERINAAVALDWLEPLNTKVNGEQQYSVVPFEERKLTYSRNAGMKLNDMMLSDIAYATSSWNVNENYSNASYQQQLQMKEWEKTNHQGYDLTKSRSYQYNRVGGVLPPEMISSANEEIIKEAENFVRPESGKPESEIIEEVLSPREETLAPRSVKDFKTPINITGVNGEQILNTATSMDVESEIPERVIESPTTGRRLSEAEAFIGDTKGAIRDKINTFLHGSSGGKWVAGLGVAAAALYTVNAMGGPLKLEDRPQGHGVKGLAGAPEDDNRTQRETKSVQVDTSNTAYVNSGEKGYTIQAKGRAGSNIDTGQLQNAVSGMQGASSVNVNIRDDRSSIDSNWLENQFSNFINRGYAGE